MPPSSHKSDLTADSRSNFGHLLVPYLLKSGKFLKIIITCPIWAVCSLMVLASDNRQLILDDVARLGTPSIKTVIYKLLFGERSWRNILYYRLNPLCSGFLKIFFRDNNTCHISTSSIGSGLLIVHGDCTYIFARSIGKNFYINQSATVGVVGSDSPVIGDNVRVATGAIVIGGITISDNVTIGAGAVVVKDVLNDCVVVGNPARIVKMKGEKVNILL